MEPKMCLSANVYSYFSNMISDEKKSKD